ncbi:TetR/AcrR family transcriptional regulator [Lentzea sp. E54]|uniref:TetR/AcrR family transcriptional regulator n=1 Tax=Lentzea xerophila TaxID=3435883 RepID=UPI003DA3B84A
MKTRGDSYGGLSRLERSAQRRSRLVDAAVELFAAREYDDVTVADVCLRAQVSKRYFYEHFTDRGDLVLKMHGEQNKWLLDGVLGAAPQDPAGPRELFLPIMTTLISMLSEHPDRARIIYINAPRVEVFRRELLRKEAEIFGRQVRKVVGPQPDRVMFQRTTLALVSGVTQVVIDWLTRGMTDPFDPLVEHLTRIACALVRELA